jgi:hypothetical protein
MLKYILSAYFRVNWLGHQFNMVLRAKSISTTIRFDSLLRESGNGGTNGATFSESDGTLSAVLTGIVHCSHAERQHLRRPRYRQRAGVFSPSGTIGLMRTGTLRVPDLTGTFGMLTTHVVGVFVSQMVLRSNIVTAAHASFLVCSCLKRH